MAATLGEHWMTLGPQQGEITMKPPDSAGSCPLSPRSWCTPSQGRTESKSSSDMLRISRITSMSITVNHNGSNSAAKKLGHTVAATPYGQVPKPNHVRSNSQVLTSPSGVALEPCNKKCPLRGRRLSLSTTSEIESTRNSDNCSEEVKTCAKSILVLNRFA